MREVKITPTFKRDMKSLQKNILFRKNASIFEKYVELLRTGQSLPEKANHHPLAKQSPKHLKGCGDFHITPDLCVIYRMTADELQLIRIGKHNQLELTENV
jgi:addiction module RelE/StbE family toxin